MTNDELQRLAKVLVEVDGGCSACAKSAFKDFAKNFPEANHKALAEFMHAEDDYLEVEDLLRGLQ